MKKFLTLFAVMMFSLGVFAQTNQNANVSAPSMKKNIGAEKIDGTGHNQSGTSTITRVIPDATIIGTTQYDLQSNSSNQRRIFNLGDGTLSATWIRGFDSHPSYPDRGTGYNFFDGTDWAAAPTGRLETQRTGWPEVVVTGSGKEVIIAHTGGSDLSMMTRDVAGTGTWTEGSVPTIQNQPLLWPRIAVSGTDNETIHLIALFDTDFTFQDVKPALVYLRSLDGGTTWEEEIILDAFTADFFKGFSGDAYTIDAKGDNVAIVAGGEFADLVLVKSDDNGATWTKSTIVDFPVVNYDLTTTPSVIDMDNDAIADTIMSSDGSYSVIIDNDGLAHVFFGRMQYLDATPADGSSSWFPGTDGVMYWNENMGTGTFNAGNMLPSKILLQSTAVRIGQTQDANGDGTITISGGIEVYSSYGVSQSSQPSAAIDANGNIYVAYASMMEAPYIDSRYYRHIYIRKSTDAGQTWGDPIDVTNHGDGMFEAVYPSLARNVDTKIHLIYQEDMTSWVACGSGDGHPFPAENNIVYKGIDVADIPATQTCDIAADFNITDEVCTTSGNIEITNVTGGTPYGGGTYGYFWNDLPNNQPLDVSTRDIVNGFYSGMIFDNSSPQCYHEFAVYVAPANAPSITNADITDAVTGTPGSIDITVEGGIAPLTFLWNDDDATTTEDLSDVWNGDYTVVITDAEDCEITETYNVGGSTAINNIEEANISIYPNPAANELNISNVKDAKIQIINALGQIVVEQVSTSDVHTFNINALQGGTYIVRIEKNNSVISNVINVIK